MIYFNATIRNPYWWNRFKNIKCWSGDSPFKNKYWEVEITKSTDLLRIEFEVTTQQDHAGVGLELGLLGYTIDFKLYDTRHWDHETNTWVKYD